MLYKHFAAADNEFYLLDLVLLMVILSTGPIQKKIEIMFDFLLFFQ